MKKEIFEKVVMQQLELDEATARPYIERIRELQAQGYSISQIAQMALSTVSIPPEEK